MTSKPILAIQLLAALAGLLSAQSVTESYAPPGSGVYHPAPMRVVNSTRTSGNGTVWSRTALGLPANGNIDAFSEGSDIFPGTGPATGPAPTVCRLILIEFSVTPATTGFGPGDIPAQAAPSGNGAASDTFVVKWTPPAAPTPPVLSTDHVGIDATKDIDALTWANKPRWPVWYSVDQTTADLMGPMHGTTFHKADVIQVTGPGATPTVFYSREDLGLSEQDDIDGLAELFLRMAQDTKRHGAVRAASAKRWGEIGREAGVRLKAGG